MALPQVSIEGRCAIDPELRYAPSGIAVTRLRLVASSRKKDENDQWVDDRQLWIDVTAFRQLAENVAESVAKGDLVVVNGKLQTDEWEKDGEKRSKIALLADSVSVSLAFRTVRHGEGKAARSTSTEQANDPWASSPSQVDEPPF